ncbi:MAG: hypothetical protein A2W27_05230 [Deltaproteobacteria bacterium RBG_16_44_11]|nr:MAG: hypothetical protein A2W27_05230 [Deltaproteobacteria bacterium RBG_16_44_11]
MKIIKIIGSIIFVIFSCIIAYADYKKYDCIKVILTILNIGIVFIISDIFSFLKDYYSIRKRKNEFIKNKTICLTSSDNFKRYFENIEYSNNENVSIISIVDRALTNYFRENNIDDFNERNAVRISMHYVIYENCEDLNICDEVFLLLKNILAQYNFRSKAKEVRTLISKLSVLLGYDGRNKEHLTIKFIKKICPHIEFYELENKLSQLTRFKNFMKEQFSNKFSPRNVLAQLSESAKENCYWVITRRIDDSIRDYLTKFPIFATIPANSHNFPSLRSVRFSHYLIRLDDSSIKNAKDLIKLLKSIRPNNSKMLLYVIPLSTKNIESLEPIKIDNVEEQYYNEIAKTTILYYVTGLLDIPPNVADFERALNSGLISLKEIVNILPLSFLIKKSENINYEAWDRIGEILSGQFSINNITDWKLILVDDLYKSLLSINKPANLKKYINSLGGSKQRNICKNIIEYSKQLSENLNL